MFGKITNNQISPAHISHLSFVFFSSYFLFRIADGIMGYIFPIVVETTVNSNTIMGIILSLSSVTGLACDFMIPSLAKRKNWRQLLILAVLLALLFPILTFLGDLFVFIWFFIMASVVWGLYFEFIMFSQQGFIIETDKHRDFSRDWGIVSVLISVMEIITPILGSILLSLRFETYPWTVVLILLVVLMLLLLSQNTRKEKTDVALRSKHRELYELYREFKLWGILGVRTYQILIVSFLLQSVFASYWIFGGLFGREIAGEEGADWIVMFLYAVPGLLSSLLMSKYLIKHHKKRISLIFMILGGFSMAFMAISEGSILLTGTSIFLSSFLFSLAYPLNNAVFSDLAVRLGKNKSHIFGLNNATSSLAYILVPLILGILSDNFGYSLSFGILGMITVVAGILLLMITPRKLLIPQKQITQLR